MAVLRKYSTLECISILPECACVPHSIPYSIPFHIPPFYNMPLLSPHSAWSLPSKSWLPRSPPPQPGRRCVSVCVCVVGGDVCLLQGRWICEMPSSEVKARVNLNKHITDKLEARVSYCSQLEWGADFSICVLFFYR